MDYNKTLLVKQELIINSLSKYFDDKCLINSITPCKNTKNYLKKYKLDFNKNYKEKSYFSNIINKLSLLFIKFRNESKIIPKNFWDSILFREVNNNIMIKINLLLNDQDIEYVWNVEIEDLCSKINNLLTFEINNINSLKKKKSPNYFVIKKLDSKLNSDILELKNWHYTMTNSDIF